MMAGSINKAILVGRVGKDPEIRTTQDGLKIANIRLATSESWKDKNSGEKRERTEWHAVCVFADALSGIVEKYVKKGDLLYVEGQIQTRKWQDQSGQDRYSTEIVLKGYGDRLDMLSSPNGNGSRPQETDFNGGRDREYERQAKAEAAKPMNDEIPF